MTTPIAMSLEGPRKPANVPHPEWTESLPDSTEKAGRLDVEGSPELRRMAGAVKTLTAHAQHYQDKIEAIKANRDLNEDGKARQLKTVIEERDDRIAKIVSTEYDNAEGHLLDRFANVEPVNLPVQQSDAARAVLFMNKLDRLSPERALVEIQKLLHSTTNEARIIVQEVLPIIEDYTETKESWRRDLPMDPVASVIRDAKVMLTSASNLGARYLRNTVAPEARAELNRVLDAIKHDGVWDEDAQPDIIIQGEKQPALRWLAQDKE